MSIKGTDVARAAGAPEHADAIEAMLQQLLIVLVKREGGSINVHVDDIDGTDNDVLGMQLLPDGKTFHFAVSNKQ